MIYVVLLLLIGFLCTETSVRYISWYVRLRMASGPSTPSVFNVLVLGIAVAQGGFAYHTFTVSWALLNRQALLPTDVETWTFVQPNLVAAALFIAIGTMLHLVPTWQLSSSRWSVRAQVLIRVVVLAALAWLFVYWRL